MTHPWAGAGDDREELLRRVRLREARRHGAPRFKIPREWIPATPQSWRTPDVIEAMELMHSVWNAGAWPRRRPAAAPTPLMAQALTTAVIECPHGWTLAVLHPANDMTPRRQYELMRASLSPPRYLFDGRALIRTRRGERLLGAWIPRRHPPPWSWPSVVNTVRWASVVNTFRWGSNA